MSRFKPATFEEAKATHKPMGRNGRTAGNTRNARNTSKTLRPVIQHHTHEQLVDVAREWLRRHHSVVLTELVTLGGECADALGFGYRGNSTLIECKASRSDFMADKKKFFRREPEHGMGLHRYFLAPADLLKADEMPAGWGLLEWNGRFVAKRRSSVLFGLRNDSAEKSALISVVRRLGKRVETGVSIRCYTFSRYTKMSGRESKNKATLSVLEEDNDATI